MFVLLFKKKVIRVLIMKEIAFALFISFLLVGCDSNKDKSGYIDAFPVVKEAALSLSPKFGGERNDIIMSHVCAVAGNTESISDFNDFFVGKKINLSDLAGQDSGFKLLSDGNLHEMKIACMGYIISSVFTPFPKKLQNELMNESEGYVAKNDAALNEMATRIRIAKANAKFFSIISKKAEKEKFDSIDNARNYLVKLISASNGLYFEMLSVESTKEQSIKIEGISERKLSFSNKEGFTYSQEKKDVSLFFHGLNWFAKNEVLGKRYLLNIYNFNG